VTPTGTLGDIASALTTKHSLRDKIAYQIIVSIVSDIKVTVEFDNNDRAWYYFTVYDRYQ
jgi:hypothetical protein